MAHSADSFETFVGVDLHKTTVTFAAVDPSGEVRERLTSPTKCVGEISRFLGKLPRPVHLAVETVGFVEWFIDMFRPVVLGDGGRFDIVDATTLENMRGKRRKTDRNDALDIARRLTRGDCPLGWIADETTAELRKLGRHWHRLSRTQSTIKHGMRSMLNAANLKGPSLDAAAAHKWLLAHGDQLKPVQQEHFGDMIDQLTLLERQRSQLRRRITLANRSVQFQADIDRLKTIPGIDEIWACIIAAEVGDFSRFPNADALETYAGIVPDEKESAGRTTSGSITKAGSRSLRWALGKAAITLCRSDADQEAKRQRLIRQGCPKPKANVAMARRLLRTIFAMMRDGTEYQRGVRTNHTKRANEARTQNRSAPTP